MDIFTEHGDVETRRVRWTGSYQRIRWGSKVGTKDEPEVILSKLFCTFSMSSPAKLQRPFRKDWGHGGEHGLGHEEWDEAKGWR